MSENRRDVLERDLKRVASAWKCCRTFGGTEGQAAVARIYRVQTDDVKGFLSKFVSDPLSGTGEAVNDWWQWALESGGGFDSYDPRRPFVVWAWFILRCKSWAYLKRRSSGGRRLVLDFEPDDERSNPADLQERAECLAMIREAVASLNPRMRAAVVSKYWDDESSKEAARKLNVKPQDIDRWSFQARKILRDRLSCLCPIGQNAKTRSQETAPRN